MLAWEELSAAGANEGNPGATDATKEREQSKKCYGAHGELCFETLLNLCDALDVLSPTAST